MGKTKKGKDMVFWGGQSYSLKSPKAGGSWLREEEKQVQQAEEKLHMQN